MWDVISGVIGLAYHSLLIGWLAAAIFWGITGAALAGWGRLPVVIGAVAGAAVPVLGAAVIGIVALAKRGASAAAPALAQAATWADRTGGVDSPIGPPTAPGWNDPAPRWSDPAGPGGYPGTDTTGYGGPSGSGWPAPAPTSPPAGWPGRPAGAQWSTAPGPSAAAPPAASWPAARIAMLAGLSLIALVFAVTFFLTWLQPPNGDRYQAFAVGAGVPLIVTILLLAAAAVLCWRAPRRWAAVLVAWFACWWLVVGLAALTQGQRLADLLARLADSTGEQQIVGAVSSTSLAIGVTVALVAAVLAIGWSIACLIAAQHSTRQWTFRTLH